MPTGYTADVANGKMTDFNDYALQCARAFGACIMLRDDPLSSDIPEFEPSPYYAESLEEAKRRLSEFDAMDEQQRRALHASEHAENVATAEMGIAEKHETLARYNAMLEKAVQFKSPSPEHDGFAKFLVEQLESSIEADCGGTYYSDLKREIPFDEWQEKKSFDLLRSLKYREEAYSEEIERTASRNKWVRLLKESLGVVPQVV